MRPAPPPLRPVLATALALLLLAAGCDFRSGPVRIGFSGPITGRWADLGVQGRNGAILAVEDLNARGGVAGRSVALAVADEGDTPEAVRNAIHELDSQGAAVLVGLMTSAAALAGLPAAEAAGLAVVSPTAMSPELTGREDGLFRVAPDLRALARALADHVADKGGQSVLLVLDQGNAPYAEPFSRAFAERPLVRGGRIAGTVFVPAGQSPDGAAVAREALAAGVRDVLAVLSARELSGLLLGLRPVAPDIRVSSSMWGFSPEFLEMAGSAAEGVASCVTYPFDDCSPGVAAFNARFRARFGYPPSFAAALGYEAVTTAARALERTGGRRKGLDRALRELDPAPGVFGDIAFDRFGDMDRPIFCSQVRNGRIHTVGPSRG